MNIEDAILHALDGNAILFLGSGFSKGSINYDNKDFPIGDETCKRLIEYGDIDVSDDSESDRKDLSYISERFLETNDAVDLLRFLDSQFRCKSIQEYHKEIAGVSWKRIYTTNYDDSFETASKEVQINRETITPEKRASDVLCFKNAIIHMNGYIGNVKKDDLSTTFKLLGRSYANKTIPESEWAISLYNDLKTSKAIVFVGYSLDYDLELQQIFASVEEVRNKSIFVTYNPSRRQRSNMQRYGEIFEGGTSKFAEKIAEIRTQYKGIEREYSLSCLKEVDSNMFNPSLIISDKDILDLFFDGDINMNHIFSAEANRYVIRREVVDEIIESYKEGCSSIIIHSDLGNGKSVIVREVEEKLCFLGHVYYLNEMSPYLKDDLDYLSGIRGIKYIVIENYNRIIDSKSSKILSLYQRSDFRYLFTVRTYLHENLYQRLRRVFNITKEKTVIFDVNALTKNDQKALYQLLETYKLWGTRSTDSSEKKKKYIRLTCKGEIKNVLLDLIKSKELERKLNSMLTSLFFNDDIKEVTLFTMMCNVIASELSLSDIVVILNKQARLAAYVEGGAREFLDFDHNRIVLKSPVVARHILQNLNYNEEIENLIKKILPILDQHSEEYENLLRMIISISNLRMIFNLNERRVHERFIRIYERAKLLKYHKENPFFWLQYSMACMDANEYERAKFYLDNAEAYSRARSIDSWQISIQKARYLLLSTIYKSDNDNAYSNFCTAHKLLIGCTTPSMYYPLRQLTAYEEYYQLFYSTFEESEKALFLYYCNEAIEIIEKHLKNKDKSIVNDYYREKELKTVQHSLKRVVNKIHRKLEN